MFYERKSGRHVCWMCIYTAYSIGSKSSAYRKSIVVARYIWKQMNIAKKTITVVSTTENYHHCSQAVIGQLCIVSYRWLANSIMSTIIKLKLTYYVILKYSCSHSICSKCCPLFTIHNSHRRIIHTRTLHFSVLTERIIFLMFSLNLFTEFSIVLLYGTGRPGNLRPNSLLVLRHDFILIVCF